MNVLHVIETLGVGGAERLLVTVLPELQRQGCKVAVAVQRPPLDLCSALEASGIPVNVLPTRHKWNLIAGARDIARLAKRQGAELIHAHLFFPAVCTALVRLFRLNQAATVVSFHNLAYAEGVNKAGLKLRLKRMLGTWLYPRGMDAAIGVSRAVATHYEKGLGLRGIDVLYNPIDLASIDQLGLENHEDSTTKPHLVLPGRMVHEKGHTDLLNALTILSEQGYEFRVSFAGDGPLRGVVEKEICSYGLSDNIEITGLLGHDEMLHVIASADIVVVPSRYEGFGLTALEAMALSRPVVASAVGGLPEIVVNRETGILVPAENPQALAKALVSLMVDAPMRAWMGKKGRIRAEEGFALPTIVAQLCEFYERVVNMRSAG